VDQGIAEKDDIDMAMKLGASFPVGPFEMAEKIGLETVKTKIAELHEKLGDCYSVPKYLG
ncbi:MAG: 3-hydroxyacyl-CoA dehydrogenase family protein, partial [Candidatus Thorarchaeota archaeon]